VDESYDLILVGTGFASSFFLYEYLKHAPETARVLVLEKGRKLPYAWKRENGRNSDIRFDSLIENATPAKRWIQNIAFGGGACWTGNTPRLLPSDFEMKSRLGIGEDWPIGYDDLEPCYQEVEAVMGIAGEEGGPYPRSAPYPCPAHPMNAFDRLLLDKYPGQWIPMPSARSSSSARTGRPRCCTDGICSLCPVTAKFQIDLHFSQVFDDSRVTLRTEASAEHIDISGDLATGVFYEHAGAERRARGEIVAVGAHAILTPFLLLRSGLEDEALGAYLNEQVSVDIQVDLSDVENFDGGQAVTGWGTMLLEHARRAEFAGCAVEGWNVPWLRAERGRWRQRGLLKLVFEDLPSRESRVTVSADDPSKPRVRYAGYSPWLETAFERLDETVAGLLSGLPVEDYLIRRPEDLGGAAHIQGTTRMGTDPNTSVVDPDLRHHRVRNLLALGAGAFPSCPAGNPTLTLSALSIRAGRQLFGGAA
jgi:choline dehydrogenase-like flavoprotein